MNEIKNLMIRDDENGTKPMHYVFGVSDERAAELEEIVRNLFDSVPALSHVEMLRKLQAEHDVTVAEFTVVIYALGYMNCTFHYEARFRMAQLLNNENLEE